jgi:molybdenum cofactor cytidylyltransferase
LVKTAGVILAAGFSSRMKTYKMTLRINGKTIIEHCLEGMYDFCSDIIVVGGFGIENIRPVLSDYKKVELVYNPNYSDGMFSSVRTGLSLVDAERSFLIPGDYPAVRASVYKNLTDAEGDIIIPTYKGERGHPVLMKSFLAREIIQSDRYTNLHEFICDKGCKEIETQDKGILMDVDTPSDYAKVIQYMTNNCNALEN